MRVHNKTLDMVLFLLDGLPDHVQKCKDMRQHMTMDKKMMDAALTKLETDGYIGPVYRIEEEDGYFAVYFNEKGRAFAATSSYRKEFWKEWPKKNWHWMLLITALIAVILKKVFG